jgi:hypothetical protein
VKRVVGICLVALAFLLCPAWVGLVPESEPELGAVALVAIIYIGAIGVVLSVDSSDPRH